MPDLHGILDFGSSPIGALLTVILIDLVLAGDNAVVVGLAAAGLDPQQRRKAIIVGIGAAAGLRIVFALFATQLLDIIGVMLVGGLLLLWVCWKLWRELRAGGPGHGHPEAIGAAALEHAAGDPAKAPAAPAAPPKTFRQALMQIVLADVSMSLDNVLAVAGTARHHLWVLVIGLALSVALMGIAATLIARLLHRYHWISYIGLALIAWVAAMMIYEGAHQIIDPRPPAAEAPAH